MLPSFPHVRLVHNPLSRLPALPLHKIVMSALGDGGLAIHLNQISVNRVYGKNFCWKTKSRTFFLDTLQCTLCSLGSMFSFQPNKLRHILKFVSWYIIQHIFVTPHSVGRKTWFSRKPWLSNSKFGISGSFWPILSVPKIMFLVPENEKRNKF